MQKFEQDAQYSGNQFLVLLKLRPRMAERLFNDHHCLEGIDYRFELQRHHQLKLRQGGGLQRERSEGEKWERSGREVREK